MRSLDADAQSIGKTKSSARSAGQDADEFDAEPAGYSQGNILLIQGRYDLLVEAEQTEELWQNWKRPEIWRLPHGHISWMGAPGLTGRVLHWVSPRLNAPAVQARPKTTLPENAELGRAISTSDKLRLAPINK